MARILVIDDEAPVRVLIEQILRPAGHEVISVANAEEALKQYRAAPADLVITDLILPSEAGVEIIIQLRRESPKLPIIAMSGKPAGGTLLDIARRLGTAVLAKPFSAAALTAAVAKLL